MSRAAKLEGIVGFTLHNWRTRLSLASSRLVPTLVIHRGAEKPSDHAQIAVRVHGSTELQRLVATSELDLRTNMEDRLKVVLTKLVRRREANRRQDPGTGHGMGM